MVVHHVEVHEIRAGVDHGAHFLAQPREVGGEQRRRDAAGSVHARSTARLQSLTSPLI